MITVTLDRYRGAVIPLVLVAELPCAQPSGSHIHVELSLHDERPIVDLRLKSKDNEPVDFFLAIVSQPQLSEWKEVARSLIVPGPQGYLTLSGTRNAMSQSGKELRVTLQRNTYPLSLTLWVWPTRQITITDFSAWGQDLGMILDMALAIDEFVEDARTKQRETLLAHVDALLMQHYL